VARINKFEETGRTDCVRHGEHAEWTLKVKNHPKGTYRGLTCKICARENSREWMARHPDYNARYKISPRSRLSRLMAGARKRAIEAGTSFDLTVDWLMECFERQGGCCAYTGRPINLAAGGRGWGTGLDAPSLDQMIPGAGYTKANVRIVCWGVNRVKSNLDLQDFVALCRDVAAHAGTETTSAEVA
jgi:hypothetical protein